MDAIIGRYRVRMEEIGLVLTHSSGISFDLTAEEALDLMDFIKVYQQALMTTERETNPELEVVSQLERIVIDEEIKLDS